MSISAISSSNPLNQADTLQKNNQQQRTEFQQLTQALQSGNLTNAQNAFSALTKSATSSGVQSLQLTQDLSRLGAALQSGDFSKARQAYSSVQQNLARSNPIAVHHHRAHHGGASQILTSGFPNSASSPVSSAANQTAVSQPVNLTA
jgi:iron uptake system EfeUOB component EfeO/EfeM